MPFLPNLEFWNIYLDYLAKLNLSWIFLNNCYVSLIIDRSLTDNEVLVS